MISFMEFMEIAVSSNAFPVASGPSYVRKSGMVHREDDPSHGVIPLVMHPKSISLLDGLERRKDAPWKYGPAMDVFERISEQPRDGGMVMVNISNSEAESIKDFAREIISDSEKVMASKVGGGIKDDAMKWMSFGHELIKSVDNGIKAATNGSRKNSI